MILSQNAMKLMIWYATNIIQGFNSIYYQKGLEGIYRGISENYHPDNSLSEAHCNGS
jgi:hypothetical protein